MQKHFFFERAAFAAYLKNSGKLGEFQICKPVVMGQYDPYSRSGV